MKIEKINSKQVPFKTILFKKNGWPCSGVLALLLCAVLLFSACEKPQPEQRKIDLKLTLGGNDKKAMGAYVFKWLVGKSFADGYINDNNSAFDKWHQSFLTDNAERTGSVYFLVAPRLIAYRDEVNEMIDFVDRGNTLFVVANYFDPYFLEQFSFDVKDDISRLGNASLFKMRDTKKQLSDSSLFNPTQFPTFFYPFQKSFVIDTSVQSEVIGLNDFGNPDLLRMPHGKGQLIVMTNANAASNYFLLTDANYNYALGALSYLPAYANSIYWDDFYRRHISRPPESDRSGILNFIFETPGLGWAFWLLILLAILWMLSHMFRQQRLIPVKKPNVNSSLEFTQTIARLYFNKKDNRNIALKMIAYFQDHVRSKYYMNYTGINEEFGRILIAKTGLEPTLVQSLINSISIVQRTSTTDDATLLALNDQIQQVLKL